jgi:hypothetical protein
MSKRKSKPAARPVNCLNVMEIARIVGLPHFTVWISLRRLGIPHFKYYGKVWVLQQDAQKFIALLKQIYLKKEVGADGEDVEIPTQGIQARTVVSDQSHRKRTENSA